MFAKTKYVLFTLNIILICLFLAAGIHMRRSHIMGMTLIDTDQVNRLAENRNMIPYDDTISLKFQGIALPYCSSDNTLYFPQNAAVTGWEGLISTPDGYSLCLLKDEYLSDKTLAIQENHIFSVYLVGKKDYVTLNLVMTGTPVINILTTSEEEPEEVDYYTDPDKFVFESQTNYYGSIDVWDPVTVKKDYEIASAYVKYHIKGATTAAFDKKSYSIHLKDDNGDSKKISLLGMRKDDDWKLNSLLTDPTFIREKTASQIWEAFASANTEVNESGVVMRYAELLIDNDYKGLYCLVEPIDSKKLGLDDNDYLYKSIDEFPPDYESIIESAENDWRVVQSMRIMFPDEIDDFSAAWYPLLNHYSIFLYYDPDTYSFERAESYIYLSNLCDRTLFNLVTSASDNSFKNTYYTVDVEDDPDNIDFAYKAREIPWDLDYTFGNKFDYYSHRFTDFDKNYTYVCMSPTFRQLLHFSPEEATDAISLRWQSYRESFLATDKIISLFEDNHLFLQSSGALLREQIRWPDQQVTSDIAELIDFQKQRMDWLDEYIANGLPDSN